MIQSESWIGILDDSDCVLQPRVVFYFIIGLHICMPWAPAVEDGIHVFSYPSNGISLLSIMSDVPLTLEMVLIEAYMD